MLQLAPRGEIAIPMRE